MGNAQCLGSPRGLRAWTLAGQVLIRTDALPHIASIDEDGAQVAQLVEHVTENHGVGGSIPPLGTKSNLRICTKIYAQS